MKVKGMEEDEGLWITVFNQVNFYITEQCEL